MDTLDKIKAGLPALRDELKDTEKLTNIYKFSFNFYREDAKSVGMLVFFYYPFRQKERKKVGNECHEIDK